MFWIAACTYATNELKLSDISFSHFWNYPVYIIRSRCVKIYFSSKLKEKLNKNTLSIIGI